MERDVVVVGGGLGGLVAANLATDAGLSVTLLEAAPHLGGRGQTREEAGFKLNLGPHAVYRGAAAERVLRRLGVPLEGGAPSTKGGLLIRSGALHALPASPMGLLASPLLPGSARIDFAKAIWRVMATDPKPLSHVTLKAWLDEHVKSPDARALLQALFRVSTYSNQPELLSAETALTQLRLGTRPGVIYLHGGWQTLVDSLKARLRSAGGEVLTGVHVTRVEPELVETSNGQSHRARTVILAVPPEPAAKLCPAVSSWTEGLTQVRAAVLDVALKRLPRPDRRLAFGLDEPHYAVVHSAFAKLAPENGAVIHLARYLRPEDQPTRAELEKLLDLLQPGWRDELVYARYFPHLVVTHALPEASRGGWRARPGPKVTDGLYAVGDWVGPEGHLLDAVCASAEAAIRELTSTLASGAEAVGM